jgi:hypothetical protein
MTARGFRITLIALVMTAAACGGGAVTPVAFDAAKEACRFCRMTGSDGRAAGQLVAPGDEALFFDDIGCLRDHLARTPAAAGAVAFVTSFATGQWVRADAAVFVEQPSVATPMASHLIAFRSVAERDADPMGRTGQPRTVETVFAGSR